jgi:hypothetical protein
MFRPVEVERKYLGSGTMHCGGTHMHAGLGHTRKLMMLVEAVRSDEVISNLLNLKGHNACRQAGQLTCYRVSMTMMVSID